MTDLTLFDWTTYGELTGGCGHRHRTLLAAADCVRDARRHFRRIGLASDRRILEVGPDDDLPNTVPRLEETSLFINLAERDDGGYALLVASIVVNRYAHRRQKTIEDVYEILGRWPRADQMARAGLELEEAIGADRASNVRRFAGWWHQYAGAPIELAPSIDRFGKDAYRIFVLGATIDTDDHALRALMAGRNLDE